MLHSSFISAINLNISSFTLGNFDIPKQLSVLLKNLKNHPKYQLILLNPPSKNEIGPEGAKALGDAFKDHPNINRL